MANQRKLIRHSIVERLKKDLIDLSDRIYPNRYIPANQKKLPCLMIYTLKEPSEISTESPREYRRDLQVIIEILVKADESLDDALDDLCSLVERSMFKDETFGGLVADTTISDTEISILADGDRLVGSAQLTLQMPYYIRLPESPEFELDDFLTADTKIDVGSDGEIESEDTLILEQE